MRRLLRSRFLVLALLLAVGAGSVVSVVQAGQMRMAMADGAQGMDGDGCTACGTGDDDAKATVNCASACHIVAVDTVGAAVAAAPVDVREVREDRARPARPVVPVIDPSPPKSILG